MSEVKWEDPPLKRGRPNGTGKFEAIAAEIKANPGRWALVQEGVNPGCITSWRRRGFETRTRAAGKDEAGLRIVDIFARQPETETEP